MPHDRHGNRLEVGDLILITAEVREVYSEEGECNVSFEPIANPDIPDSYRPTLTMNSKLVEKAAMSEEVEVAQGAVG